MFTVLFLIVPLVLKSSGQPCEDKNSIDVSGGKVFSDGTVFKDGVAFPPKLVYSKNISGEIRSFGCVCELKTCLRKCCPLGSVMYKRSCTKMEDVDILLKSGVDLYFQNAFQRRVKLDTAEDLFVIHDRPCKKMYLEDDGHWFMQETGSYHHGDGQIQHYSHRVDKTFQDRRSHSETYT
ncbi:unnamed protein product, partial [Iphiclides podalirius]